MDKDAFLFLSLNTTIEKNIYIEDDFSLDTIGHVDLTCQCGHIVDVFHVPSLCMNPLLVSQLT